MNLVSTFRKLKNSDEKLDEISKRISFNAVNPTNVEEEKVKFFESDDYNPQFKYRKYREDLEKLREEIKKIKSNSTVVGKIITKIKQDYINKTYMLENRGEHTKFTNYSKKVYGEPDEALVKEARKYMEPKPIKDPTKYTTKQLIKKFELAFLKYGFPWSVEEKDMVARAAVITSKKTIYLRKNTRFSENFLKRLIVHEIGTHVTRYENGNMQPYLFFRRGLPGYLMTEEGLAVFNEEINHCSNPNVLKMYAGRVLAIDAALNYSFRETYNILLKHFTKKTAFRLATRAKRGLSDTSKKGACTKDINYFKGYIAIKDFLKKGGDITKLYYGKVGLEHIELLDDIPNLVNPNFLPMFRHLNFITHHFSDMVAALIHYPLIPLKNINNKWLRKKAKE